MLLLNIFNEFIKFMHKNFSKNTTKKNQIIFLLKEKKLNAFEIEL